MHAGLGQSVLLLMLLLAVTDILQAYWLLPVIAHSSGHTQHEHFPKCLPDIQATSHASRRRHIYYAGRSEPLTVGVSHRASHWLVSHVLQILLHEVVGYEHVYLRHGYNSMNPVEILHRISGCITDGAQGQYCDAVPDTMVDLEVWSPAGFSMEKWIAEDLVHDAGPLGPSGRFGWFMPTSVVEKSWEESRQIIDHWRALEIDEVASQFAPHNHDRIVDWSRTNYTAGHHICHIRHRHHCHQGILKVGSRSGKCLSQDECALLVSSFPDIGEGVVGIDSDEVIREQILRLGLKVDISWLGDHLHSYVQLENNHSRPVLFFDWVPNTLSSTGNYTRIKFPQCKATEGPNPINCDFEVNQMSKMMWPKLERNAPEAYQVISHMGFSQQQYVELLQLFVMRAGNKLHHVEDIIYHQAACEWVKDNRNLWQEWIPRDLSNKSKIYIGGMFHSKYPAIVLGAEMAENFVNADPSILQNYELVVIKKNPDCRTDLVLKQFMYYTVNDTHPVVGILGPLCSENAKPIAAVANHYNSLIVSYGSEFLMLANRTTYPMFFRTFTPLKHMALVYVATFNQFNWHQVALLAEDSQEFPEYHAYLQEVFIQHDVAVPVHRIIPARTYTNLQKYMAAIKEKNLKIILLTAFQVMGCAVVCEAYKQGMVAKEGYVWFFPHWWTLDFYKCEQNINMSCTTSQIVEVIAGCLRLESAPLNPDKQAVVAGNLTVQEWTEEYTKRLTTSDYGIDYASYAYDSVWVFAYALEKLLKEEPAALEEQYWKSNRRTFSKFIKYISESNFYGATGLIKFVNGDREVAALEISQFMGNKYMLVGQYQHHRNISKRLEIPLEDGPPLYWSKGKIPTDGSDVRKRCNIEDFRAFLGVDCDTAIVIANVIGVVGFGLLMFVCLILVKRRYDKKVHATRRRMQELGLLSDVAWLSLDQWEIARDRVVLNRKLGEGAFGTVYGGETLIDESWVAVAVKTLKIGSTAEEKLDFLSEAEMMKRFDHDNIMKLLAVCTRGEPAYTIMEFMLHGDLKTYLLSRRHLVGQTNKEAEDVSAESLTKMACDIAQGLQYLTELKYVHRDLACRNCLVHSTKTIKLGDFGMTRAIYDSGYYRFNKRGMLPVRWMAPESLSDGLFTAASDIWSYGVLLFEIITFGSFPYQGLCNKQVLEYVKNGSTISLPSHCPDELRDLLLDCWSYEAECRPTVESLIETLKESIEMLKPCLDAPRSAVSMEATDSVNVALPRARHRSAQRTSSEHSQLHNLNSESRSFAHSPSSSVPPDPFSMLSNSSNDAVKEPASRVKRYSQSSVIHNRTQTGGGSEPGNGSTGGGDGIRTSGHVISSPAEDPVCEGSSSCQPSSSSSASSGCSAAGCSNSTCPHSGSPASSLQLKLVSLPASLEERVDSDYCSDHSKEYWHSNSLSAV